jgi:hypothetical protein
VATLRGRHGSWLLRQLGDGPIFHEPRATVSASAVEFRAWDTTGELLGFDCMAALTTRPAAEVANAAQKWSQEDDITVLTIRRGD